MATKPESFTPQLPGEFGASLCRFHVHAAGDLDRGPDPLGFDFHGRMAAASALGGGTSRNSISSLSVLAETRTRADHAAQPAVVDLFARFHVRNRGHETDRGPSMRRTTAPADSGNVLRPETSRYNLGEWTGMGNGRFAAAEVYRARVWRAGVTFCRPQARPQGACYNRDQSGTAHECDRFTILAARPGVLLWLRARADRLVRGGYGPLPWAVAWPFWSALPARNGRRFGDAGWPHLVRVGRACLGMVVGCWEMGAASPAPRRTVLARGSLAAMVALGLACEIPYHFMPAVPAPWAKPRT